MHIPVDITGFKHILIVGICFLSVYNLPTTLAMPVDNTKEWWIHTTDLSNANASSKCSIVKIMCKMASVVKTHANDYLNSHLLPIPGQATWDVPEYFPKKGGDEVDSSIFGNIGINEFTKNIYNDLQKYALGLDIMHRYQVQNPETDAGKTHEKTSKLMEYLQSLLYEINEYFNAFNIIKKEDVREGDFTIEDMDVGKFTAFSNVLIKEFMNNMLYVQAGLNFYNETECN